MKRLLLSIVMVFPLLMMSCVQEGKPDTEPAEGDGTSAKFDDAVSATYAAHAALATVVDWDGNTLQEGSNGYTCMPTPPAFEERGVVSPMCLDDVWMAWADAWQNKTPFSTDKIGIAYMLAGDGGASNIDPWADGPTDDNEWIVEGAHLMLIAPNSSLLEGIPTDPSYGGPYVMWRGTDYEHVMVPVKAADVTDVADLLEDALSAADTNMQAGVAAMDWDGNMLQEGDNGYTCMSTPPQFTSGRAPMCFDAAWVAWGEAWMNKGPFSTDQLGIAYMLSGDEGSSNIDPYAQEPTDDNVWVKEGPHMMLIVPEAMLEGITRNPDNGGPYVMWDGTPYVHVMVPIAGRP